MTIMNSHARQADCIESMQIGGYVRAIVKSALMLQPTEATTCLHVYALTARPGTSASAA